MLTWWVSAKDKAKAAEKGRTRRSEGLWQILSLLLRNNQRTPLSMVFWGEKNCIENANSSFHECLCCLWLSSAETPDVKFQRCLCFQYNVTFCWKVSTLWNHFETILWKIYQAWPCVGQGNLLYVFVYCVLFILQQSWYRVLDFFSYLRFRYFVLRFEHLGACLWFTAFGFCNFSFTPP